MEETPYDASPREVLGKAIRARRRSLGWTQDQLSDQLGVSQQSVGNWERGRNSPSPRIYAALVALIDLRTDELGVAEIREPAKLDPASTEWRQLDQRQVDFVNFLVARLGDGTPILTEEAAGYSAWGRSLGFFAPEIDVSR